MKTTKQNKKKENQESIVTYSIYFTPLSLDLNVIIPYFLYCGNCEIYHFSNVTFQTISLLRGYTSLYPHCH